MVALSMALFGFLYDKRSSPLRNFWRLDKHDVPELPGVYVLVARSDIRFRYPNGSSPIFYIGQARSLRKRLLQHLRRARKVHDAPQHPMDWPRYEYAAKFGERYCFIRTTRGLKPKTLEDMVMARFARRYHSWPVANSAGAWTRILDEVEGD